MLIANLHTDVWVIFAEIIVANKVLRVDDVDSEDSFRQRVAQQVCVDALHQGKWITVRQQHHSREAVLGGWKDN